MGISSCWRVFFRVLDELEEDGTIIRETKGKAVLFSFSVSMEEFNYRVQFEPFLDKVDELILLEQATLAQDAFNQADAVTLSELMEKYGLDPAEVNAAAESVEIE